jgi:DNA-binding transcriptional regulator YiaG
VALRARLLRLLETVEHVGLEALRAPHVRHLDGKLWELRVRADGGIARGIYVTAAGRRVVGAACLREEVAGDAAPGARDRRGADEAGDAMTKLKDLKARLMEDPEFREEYARIDGEYALIEALVRARTAAKLTQAELASRLGTTQSAVARLEGGRVSPSFATLRRYAEATGTRLTVDLVPAGG